jgi:hypothetical protein
VGTFQEDNRILVCTVARYPPRAADVALTALRASAARQGIALTVFGVGETCATSYERKAVRFKADVEAQAGRYDYVLYTDASDSVFLGPLPELFEKYRASRAALLLSAEVTCWPFPELAEDFFERGRFRFPNAGGFIGRTDALLDGLGRLLRLAAGAPYANHLTSTRVSDQGAWSYALAKGAVVAGLDWRCDVFQTTAGVEDGLLAVEGGRVVNRLTGTRPSVLHFNGSDKRSMPAFLCKLFGWEFFEVFDVGTAGVTGRLFLDAQ